jgi:hypothetical protein
MSPDAVRPAAVNSLRIIAVGTGCWVLALGVTLAVPAMHQGQRDWWPWTCVTGAVLGLIGLAYVRRGRGNAADPGRTAAG